jgi:hypothetical protein
VKQCPSASYVYRYPIPSRRMLLGCTAMLGTLVLLRHAWSEPAVPDPKADTPFADTPFMELSALLIAHRLNPVIGGRIAMEMKANQPPLSDQIDALLKLARSKNATRVEEFFHFADDVAKAAAQRIISAWYLGVIDDVPGATVIAYELALMFQPTADVMTIPTYSISGPNGWDSKALPLEAMPIF